MFFAFPKHVSVMGILNVTPDSFSDGGRHSTVADAVLRAHEMVGEGVDIIDIGGESTRPGSDPVDVEEEERRVLPVLRALRDEGLRLPISVDTRHSSVAEKSLALGAEIINDVSAFESDPMMVDIVRDGGAKCVLMHGYSPRGADVPCDAKEVAAYLASRIAFAESHGIAKDRIIVDPGFGFNKNTDENLALLSHLDVIMALGLPVLVGLSRKRFIGAVTGETMPDRRVGGSVAGAMIAAMQGAEIVRVHDVKATKDALQIMCAAEFGITDNEV